jgi:hypothetical protein
MRHFCRSSWKRAFKKSSLVVANGADETLHLLGCAGARPSPSPGIVGISPLIQETNLVGAASAVCLLPQWLATSCQAPGTGSTKGRRECYRSNLCSRGKVTVHEPACHGERATVLWLSLLSNLR